MKVPHMGWNQIEIKQPNPLLEGIPDLSSFYFVYSYVVQPSQAELVLAQTEYGVSFASVVGRDRVLAFSSIPKKAVSWG